VLEFVRSGSDLGLYYPFQLASVDHWTGEVSEFLRAHEGLITTGLIEDFLAAQPAQPHELLARRNVALQRITDSLREDS
jgi:hypothetical protein